MLLLVIFVSQLLWVYSLAAEEPVVTTPLGKIRGHYKQSYGNCTFSAFEGIAYAQPPIDTLRFEVYAGGLKYVFQKVPNKWETFLLLISQKMYVLVKEPQDVKPWSGVWDATTIHECIQLGWPHMMVFGNEDCLYLNVYVPKEQPIPNEKLDVVVHIHGGAFMTGSPNIAGPEYLMDRDIIYINLNYRLGVLGFLSTEDDVVSGNNGMKDQTFALKWIQENIAYFGGNPESVTIVGESAGGASVHFHYFSQLSKGLFHRGVSHSGTALSPWTFQEAPLEKAQKLATAVGCNHHSTKEFVKCMKQQSAKHLVDNVKLFYADYGCPFSPFAAVVEKKHKASFLTDYPFKLLESGQVHDVPWITSVTTEDGIYPALFLLDVLDDIDKHWDKAMPHILDYNYTVSNSDKAAVSQKIKQFYFGDKKLSQDTFRTFIKLLTDRHFSIDFEKASRLQANVTKSPVYTVLYGYKGSQKGVIEDYFRINLKEDYGVGHADDASLLYYSARPGATTIHKLSSSDELIKELLSDIITSFAKHSKPEIKGINWKPVTNSEDFEYLFIQKPDEVNMASKQDSSETEFWRSLPILENENIISIKYEL